MINVDTVDTKNHPKVKEIQDFLELWLILAKFEINNAQSIEDCQVIANIYLRMLKEWHKELWKKNAT